MLAVAEAAEIGSGGSIVLIKGKKEVVGMVVDVHIKSSHIIYIKSEDITAHKRSSSV